MRNILHFLFEIKSSEDQCLGFLFSFFAHVYKKCINEGSMLKHVYHVILLNTEEEHGNLGSFVTYFMIFVVYKI